MNIEIKKNLAKNWFILLRNIICYEIEELEKEFGTKKNKNPKKFRSQTWRKSINNDEGGGEFKILNDGLVFEKVGVNFSEVYGKFSTNFKNKILGSKNNPKL
jgi:coproporphyrinogen III oxidase